VSNSVANSQTTQLIVLTIVSFRTSNIILRRNFDVFNWSIIMNCCLTYDQIGTVAENAEIFNCELSTKIIFQALMLKNWSIDRLLHCIENYPFPQLRQFLGNFPGQLIKKATSLINLLKFGNDTHKNSTGFLDLWHPMKSGRTSLRIIQKWITIFDLCLMNSSFIFFIFFNFFNFFSRCLLIRYGVIPSF